MPKESGIRPYECNDYPWEQVDKKSIEILAGLIHEKYSYVDLAWIGQQLIAAANYLASREAARIIIENEGIIKEK